MGEGTILGNEAADVVANNAAEKVKALEVHEMWMSGGGYTAVSEEEEEGKHRGTSGYQKGDGMGGRRHTRSHCVPVHGHQEDKGYPEKKGRARYEMGQLGGVGIQEVGEDGQVDDEGRAVLERVDLMNVHILPSS